MNIFKTTLANQRVPNGAVTAVDFRYTVRTRRNNRNEVELVAKTVNTPFAAMNAEQFMVLAGAAASVVR